MSVMHNMNFLYVGSTAKIPTTLMNELTSNSHSDGGALKEGYMNLTHKVPLKFKLYIDGMYRSLNAHVKDYNTLQLLFDEITVLMNNYNRTHSVYPKKTLFFKNKELKVYALFNGERIAKKRFLSTAQFSFAHRNQNNPMFANYLHVSKNTFNIKFAKLVNILEKMNCIDKLKLSEPEREEFKKVYSLLRHNYQKKAYVFLSTVYGKLLNLTE